MTGIKPDFKKAYMLANDILVSSKTVSDFPISIKSIVKEKGKGLVKCKSFSKAKIYNVDVRDFGSDSAVIIKYHGKYVIFYDDSEPAYRINFSIAHEFGHFLLKHNLNLPKGERYDCQEIETNYFAAQLIMPEQIIRAVQKRGERIDKSFIKKTFNTSDEAADKRLGTLARTNYEMKSRTEKEYDDLILLKYRSFIDSICPLKSDFYDYDYEEEMQNKRNSWL